MCVILALRYRVVAVWLVDVVLCGVHSFQFLNDSWRFSVSCMLKILFLLLIVAICFFMHLFGVARCARSLRFFICVCVFLFRFSGVASLRAVVS